MDFRKVVESKQELKTKETGELAKIYQVHNRSEWSEEDFEAMRQLLQERGHPIPGQQNAGPARPRVMSSKLAQYEGVKGWLLFFCFALTVLVPLVGAYNIYTLFQELSPSFWRAPVLKKMALIFTILSVGIVLFSMISGFRLWTKKPGAVGLAKIYLFTYLIYRVVIAGLPFAFGFSDSPDLDLTQLFLKEVIYGLAVVVLWALYLGNSKRVKATYT
jgi:hypothetical protein